jgi:Mn2+/Fe2+ NRAMP family transporter
MLLAAGHYRWLRAVNLGLLALLAIGTAIAFAAAPPPVSALPKLVTPSFPVGSLVLVSAILGFMPTSVAVSVWQSLWALEHGRFRGDGSEKTSRPGRRKLLADGLFDLRIGYGLSAVMAVLFVCLGAVLLHPRGLVPEGPDVAVILSRLYTLVLGEWMRPLVLAMAFAALFTTCYTMMDGFPRSFVAARRVLRGHPSYGGRVDRVYWTFLLTVTFGGMAILSLVPDPAKLVKAVGAFGLVLSPVYYVLNLWAVTRLVDDPDLRPGKTTVGLAIAGILAMAGTAVLLLTTTL